MEDTDSKPVRIILTGPESTGKTALSVALAREYGGHFIEEYARRYIQTLARPYTWEDVLHIAEWQVTEMEECLQSGHRMIFCDTYLIITKVWFQHVYKRVPVWLAEEIEKTRDALYLLCRPDIPWEPDPLRENGGAMREILFRKYELELTDAGLHFEFVGGSGGERIENAKRSINRFMIK